MGWHNHWDELAASATDFLWDPAQLVRYDQQAVQARVLAEGSVDMMLATRLHGLDLTAAPDFNPRFAAWFGRACGAPGPLTIEGMELAHSAMKQLVLDALSDRPHVAPEPLVTRAALTLLEASIAHLRGRGEFHEATNLCLARDAMLPLAAEQFAAEQASAAPVQALVQRAAPVAAEPARNAPCWCGSGQKYKKCHAAQAA
jgi:hypothetical protein